MASDSDKPEAVVMGCGPAEGVTLAHQCRGCGMESDDIEDFNVSTCWGCCERAHWGDLCQQERHGECENGDPDDPEFCPCPCHDQDASALPLPPGGGAGGGPVEPPPQLAPARTAAVPSSPVEGTAAPLDPVPPPTSGGTGSGQVEPPPRRLAPSRAAPGSPVPGATAGAPPRGEAAPAVQAPSPSPIPSPRGGRDGEGLNPASGGNAAPPLAGRAPAGGDGTADAAPPAGQDWGVFVDEVRLFAIGGEGAEWWAVWHARQHPSRVTCLEMTLPGGSWHVACDSREDAALLRDLMTGRGLHPATVKVARLADCIAATGRRKAAREARAESMEQVHGAQMRLNAEKRNRRGHPWAAKGQPGYGAGGNRRMPPPPAGGAA